MTRLAAQNQIAITLDIDWAPDFMIDYVAEILLSHQVRATWFVTHSSPAVERLRQQPDLFELGLHPNFLPHSTHGATVEAVLEHCMILVPEATSLRTHALVQSTPLLEQVLAQTRITTDVSLFLPHTSGLRPVEYQLRGRTLLRIPYYWEDDFEMYRDAPCWHLAPLLSMGEGLKVFDLHPVHIYLNSRDMQPYQALKRSVRQLTDVTPAAAKSHVQDDTGTQVLLNELVQYLSDSGQSSWIRDIYNCWQGEEAPFRT